MILLDIISVAHLGNISLIKQLDIIENILIAGFHMSDLVFDIMLGFTTTDSGLKIDTKNAKYLVDCPAPDEAERVLTKIYGLSSLLHLEYPE